MNDLVNDYLSANRSDCWFRPVPRLVCADQFSMSVQAGDNWYCAPRQDRAETYTEVEVGFPSAREELLMPYCENTEQPTGTVYAYVPVDVVCAIIVKHGGIAE